MLFTHSMIAVLGRVFHITDDGIKSSKRPSLFRFLALDCNTIATKILTSLNGYKVSD